MEKTKGHSPNSSVAIDPNTIKTPPGGTGVQSSRSTQDRIADALERLASEEHRRVELLEVSVDLQRQGMEQSGRQHDEQQLALAEYKQQKLNLTPTEEVLLAIRDERARQMDIERWTPEHDDQHTQGELAEAACYYASPVQAVEHDEGDGTDSLTRERASLRRLWPVTWDDEFAKKSGKTRRQQLVVAGALIVAEVERMDRIEKSFKDDECPFEDVPGVHCSTDGCPESERCHLGEARPTEKQQKVHLTVIISGQDVPIDVDPEDHLVTVRLQALAKSHNVGRPSENWELRNENGDLLSAAASLEQAGVKPNDRLFLSPAAGAGG